MSHLGSKKYQKYYHYPVCIFRCFDDNTNEIVEVWKIPKTNEEYILRIKL